MELKPCPFCGGIANVYSAGWNKFVAGCETENCYCNAMIHDLPVFIEKDEAIEAWNRRAE